VPQSSRYVNVEYFNRVTDNPEAAVTIKVNGKPESIGVASVSVAELLTLQNVKMPDMVSVQLNGDILERASFPTTAVQENDEVEFLYFMGGGA
jgi:sulfur carrier protein